MSKDVTCPYCRAEQDICTDDGYGLEEDGDYEQECNACGRTFKFTTSILVTHEAFCVDDHVLEPWPKHPGMWGCTRCGYCERRTAAGGE